MATNRNFYKKNSGSKKVLRQVIRPTHKKTSDDPEIDEPKVKRADFDLSSVFSKPQESTEVIKSNEIETEEKEIISHQIDDDHQEEVENKIIEPDLPKMTLPSLKPENNYPSSETDSEILQISQMIAKASEKLKELEEQKKQREIEAAKISQEKEVEEFDGLSGDNEEIELIKAQLEKTQKDNKQLLHQINLMKDDFEKEKKHLEKTVRDLKNELHRTTPIQENKFFSFSKDLREAVEAIHSLESPDFEPIEREVVLPVEPKILKIDGPESTSLPKTPIVAPKLVETVKEEPKKVDEHKKTESLEAVADTPKPPKDTAPIEDDPHVKKKKKEKKLLISGVASLVVLVLGGFMSYKLTSTPKVNDKLVNEYLEANKNSQVLGVQSRTGVVPEGVVADKNAEINFEETHWAEYRDDNFGLAFDYPANVTERLHTANTITFLRKDSYIFKVTKQTSTLKLQEFWDQQKDKGINYEAVEIEFENRPALHLKIQEDVEFPGDRYLIKNEDVIYDVFFITDPTKYDPQDVERASKMIESFRLI